LEKSINAKVKYDGQLDKYDFILECPLSLCWQVTRKCNLACTYCVADSKTNISHSLTTEQCLEILNQLAELGLARLDFSGGEPLLREDFELLLQKAYEYNINSVVTTNGFLISDKQVDYLSRYTSLVQISIDGKKELHNEQRKGNVFDNTVQNVKRLINAGCKVRLNTFLHRNNIQDLDWLLSFSKDLGVFSHSMIFFSPQGRGLNYEELMISNKDIPAIKQKLVDYIEKTGFYIRLWDSAEYEHTCILINAEGDVIAQALYDKDSIIMGNILIEKAKDIFIKPGFNHFLHLSHYLQKRNNYGL
jgi:MoaA/NifB/PqqE/SkfB family radical SAM enzyme